MSEQVPRSQHNSPTPQPYTRLPEVVDSTHERGAGFRSQFGFPEFGTWRAERFHDFKRSCGQKKPSLAIHADIALAHQDIAKMLQTLCQRRFSSCEARSSPWGARFLKLGDCLAARHHRSLSRHSGKNVEWQVSDNPPTPLRRWMKGAHRRYMRVRRVLRTGSGPGHTPVRWMRDLGSHQR